MKITSEKRQRSLSKDLITTQIVGEIAPFTKSLKGGGEDCLHSWIKIGGQPYQLVPIL